MEPTKLQLPEHRLDNMFGGALDAFRRVDLGFVQKWGDVYKQRISPSWGERKGALMCNEILWDTLWYMYHDVLYNSGDHDSMSDLQMIVLSIGVVSPMPKKPINGFNPTHKKGYGMAGVYGTKRILRYIGLICFGDVWCPFFSHFGVETHHTA